MADQSGCVIFLHNAGVRKDICWKASEGLHACVVALGRHQVENPRPRSSCMRWRWSSGELTDALRLVSGTAVNGDEGDRRHMMVSAASASPVVGARYSMRRGYTTVLFHVKSHLH